MLNMGMLRVSGFRLAVVEAATCHIIRVAFHRVLDASSFVVLEQGVSIHLRGWPHKDPAGRRCVADIVQQPSAATMQVLWTRGGGSSVSSSCALAAW